MSDGIVIVIMRAYFRGKGEGERALILVQFDEVKSKTTVAGGLVTEGTHAIGLLIF